MYMLYLNYSGNYVLCAPSDIDMNGRIIANSADQKTERLKVIQMKNNFIIDIVLM